MAATLPREFREDCARKAWELRVQRHLTLREISEQLPANPLTGQPISDEAIRQWLRTVERRLAKEFAARAEGVKARHAAQLEHIAKLALEQWYHSCGEVVSVTVTSGRVHVHKLRSGNAEGGYEERTEQVELPDLVATHTEVQTGDPRLLQQAREALADVRAIWGLDAPRKSEVTGKDGGPIQVKQSGMDLSTLSDEELMQLEQLTEKAAGGAANRDPGGMGEEG